MNTLAFSRFFAALAAGLALSCGAAHAQSSPFLGDPDNAVAQWVRENPAHPLRAKVAQRIAAQPMARWVGDGNIRDWVSAYTGDAARRGLTALLVAYNIPQRDCGQWSEGGAEHAAAYRGWLREQLVPSLGSGKVALILEPDSLIHLTPECLDEDSRKSRVALLSEAVDLVRAHAPQTRVYLDGGDAYWNTPEIMVPRLVSANIRNARGFALNVSNYNTTAQALATGQRMQAMLRDQYGIQASFVIDVGRNGNGPNARREWCNPEGRKLGAAPRLARAGEAFEALLWIKPPGTSDGNCGIGPGTESGVFYPHMAEQLLR